MTRPIQKDVTEAIKENIARFGRHIVGVLDGEPAFAYTIGNWTRGLPELLIVGEGHEVGYLNALSEEMIRRGQAFADGEIVELANWSAPFKLINANARAQDEFTVQAGNFYCTDNYPVQQILFHDRQGYFPDEPGYRARHPMLVLARQ
jgi:hypothetical protein